MRGIGLYLVVIGATVVTVFLGYYYVTLFLFDPEIHVVLRVGITAIIVGIALMLIAFVRDRYRTMQQESFRGVEK